MIRNLGDSRIAYLSFSRFTDSHLVQFVLQVYERLVDFVVERHAPQDRAAGKGAQLTA